MPVFQPNATASTVPDNYAPLPQIIPAAANAAAAEGTSGQYEKPRPALRMSSTRPAVVAVSAASSGAATGMQFNRHFEFWARNWAQNLAAWITSVLENFRVIKKNGKNLLLT